MNMTAWDILDRNGKKIDTVFYAASLDQDYVEQAMRGQGTLPEGYYLQKQLPLEFAEEKELHWFAVTPEGLVPLGRHSSLDEAAPEPMEKSYLWVFDENDALTWVNTIMTVLETGE